LSGTWSKQGRISSSPTRRRSRRSLLPENDLTAARTALDDAYLRTGDYDAVDTILENVLHDARAAGDRPREAAVLAQQGMVLHFRAIELPQEERAAVDSGPELDLFERALAIRRELDDPEGLAESLWEVGLVHQVLRRDSERAGRYFREALDVVDGLPDCDPWLRSEIHRHVGFDHLLSGRHEAALAELRTSLEIRESLDEQGWCVGGLTALAAVSRQAGRRDDAIGYASRAAALARELGLRQRHLETATNELRAAKEMPAADASL
jgi:tetratricopeptide (TPR) repeat protein